MATTTEPVYSTGEVTARLRISRTYLKLLATVANIHPPRMGCKRKDRVWSEAHIAALRPLIKRKGTCP